MTPPTVGNAVMPVHREQLVVMACVSVSLVRPTAMELASTPAVTPTTVGAVAMSVHTVKPAQVELVFDV